MKKSKFNIFIAILFVVVILTALSSLENIIEGGDFSGYYSSIEDFRNAYPIINPFDEVDYIYEDSTIVTNLKGKSDCYDFVVKNDKLSIIGITYKKTSSGEKFKYRSTRCSESILLASIIEKYENKYNEGKRNIDELFEQYKFIAPKDNLWICILSTDYTLEIPGVEKYEFSYNNEPYILYVKLIPAE